MRKRHPSLRQTSISGHESVAVPGATEVLRPRWTRVKPHTIQYIAFDEPVMVREFGAKSLSFFSSLQSIVIPGTVEVLGVECFFKSQHLRSCTFQIPSVLRRIEQDAFTYCVSLETISLPGSVEFLGIDCFSYCGRLHTVSFESLDRLLEIC
jgi:hypothetical protein